MIMVGFLFCSDCRACLLRVLFGVTFFIGIETASVLILDPECDQLEVCCGVRASF